MSVCVQYHVSVLVLKTHTFIRLYDSVKDVAALKYRGLALTLGRTLELRYTVSDIYI